MAMRTTCLYDGKLIGIETIFTVINGRQINIKDKVEKLRSLGRNDKLFCPCGCGANLIVVAGDKNIREQHFRVKDGAYEKTCEFVTESKASVDSKIVLKCWLDDKLETDDIETRVPISYVGDTNRKYEFSFLSRGKRIAVNYCRDRANLADEKFDILKVNSDGINIIHVVDIMNGGNNGQYPEALMKIQKKQGYCLLLEAKDCSYTDAMMYAVFYMQGYDGLWKEVELAADGLRDYAIADNGQIIYNGKLLSDILEEKKNHFEEENKSLAEEQKRINEKQRRIAEEQSEAERERREKLKKEHEQRIAEIKMINERINAEKQAEKESRDEGIKRKSEMGRFSSSTNRTVNTQRHNTGDPFLNAKRRAMERYFNNLNDMQREAVFTVNGPLLILAGAGSGKTTVLVNRVANMIYFGNAYFDTTRFSGVGPSDEQFLIDYAEGRADDNERLKSIIAVDCVNPWSILAITFTNKAAGELKTRLNMMLGAKADGITAATFHSACVRILRREIMNLGYDSNFTIYDTDDSVRVIKACLADLGMSDKLFQPKSVLGEISHSKESQISAEEYAAQNANDYRKKKIGEVYTAYQKRLRSANAVDFDDILLLTVKLFEEFPDVLSHYQNLYKYILVDEYQDTNMVQYRLVSLLSEKRKNLCVVGDDDQSIYKFRGATIENILSFENQFDNAKVIRLEQNYRSTQAILNCANEVIKNNRGRKGKNLWTAGSGGDKVILYKASGEQGEARFVAQTIYKSVKLGGKWSDNAVLYRMNAQSNSIERALVASGISYRVIGGVKFYDRKEIKDIIAYLSVLNNENDMLRLRRIINEPKRGIGEASVDMLEQVAAGLSESPLAVMRKAGEYPILSRTANKLTALAGVFDELKVISESEPLDLLLDELMEKTGYLEMLKAQGDEGAGRLENINELKSTMVNYYENAEEPSLSGFLEEIALYTDIDSLDADADAVTLMTVHAAKGLEFQNVFVIGLEENIFPSSRSMDSEEDIEEERRLCYVAITRARKRLYLCCARQRMLFGSTSYNKPSRFIGELPTDYVDEKLERSESERPRVDRSERPANNQTAGFGVGARSSKAPAGGSGGNFMVGDRVSHNIFGEGIILKAVKMSGDTLLEVAFEKVGTKKIMANFAKIKKL